MQWKAPSKPLAVDDPGPLLAVDDPGPLLLNEKCV